MILARALVVAAITSLIVLGALLWRYESARDAWRAHAVADHYDASASDTAYHAVEDAFAWVERASRVGAALIVAAGIAMGRARPRRERSGSRWARAIDLATLGLVLAASRLRVPSPALTQAIDWIAPALLLAFLLGLAVNGASVGQRLFK